MKVLVCGGRDYIDYPRIKDEIREFDPSLVITGGCSTGADYMAAAVAREHGIQTAIYEANWPYFGYRAGPIRNSIMIATSQPNLVLAFPGGKGTADCVRKAREAGIEVRMIE